MTDARTENQRLCRICGDSVLREAEQEHLASEHPSPVGGFRFHFEAREFATDKPSIWSPNCVSWWGQTMWDWCSRSVTGRELTSPMGNLSI